MIEIISYPSEPQADKLRAILGRRAGLPAEVEETVRDILRQVREGGDRALAELTRRIEKVELEPEQFRVPVEVLDAAADALDAELRAAIVAAVANIRAFHERQKINSWFMEDGDGVILGKKVIPIRRVGVCVPGGQAPLISSLLMAAVPAQVAGVEEICVVSPPKADGRPHPDIMGAARLLGLEEIYGIGGAQAVGAMAFGTESIGQVDKIVGPGSLYTVAAKQQVFGIVGIEMIPGPSEIVVLADEEADPRYIAADLLSQAEHGTGFEASVCITPSTELAQGVRQEVIRQAEALPGTEVVETALRNYGAIVVVPDLETGIELLNRMAPEHAELLVAEPWAWLEGIKNAGAVFMGSASTEPVGDYFAGTNHILPTNGTARYASSLGLGDFVKTTSIVAYSDRRLQRVSGQIATLARAEGLEAHARAVEIRTGDDRRES
jgi:histidinol dehydrogenase